MGSARHRRRASDCFRFGNNQGIVGNKQPRNKGQVMRAVMSGLSALLIGIGPSWAAGAVEESLRPQLRPGSGLITAAAVVVNDVPVRVLRPQLRPEGLRATPVTSNSGFDR